jgi:uncharacterized GH25 family protein
MQIRRALIAGSLTALLTTAAAAHDTWMISNPIGVGNTIGLHITSGMEFPQNDTGPKAERVAAAGWRAGERTGKIANFEETDAALIGSMHVTGDVTAVAWVAFKPREIDLDAEEVQHYFDEIGAPERLRRTWEQLAADHPFHETYTKYAKTFVRVGHDGEDPSCIPALGSALELVPTRDPTTLSPGDSLVVRVLKSGYPVEGQAVGAVCGDDGTTHLKYANQSGHVVFPIHVGGPWLIRAVELRLQSDNTWNSDFTTMTFFAREE